MMQEPEAGIPGEIHRVLFRLPTVKLWDLNSQPSGHRGGIAQKIAVGQVQIEVVVRRSVKLLRDVLECVGRLRFVFAEAAVSHARRFHDI